jgi:hypothetical protein
MTLAPQYTERSRALIQAYHLFDRRRPMMQMWSDFCAGRDADGEVVPIRRSEVSA